MTAHDTLDPLDTALAGAFARRADDLVGDRLDPSGLLDGVRKDVRRRRTVRRGAAGLGAVAVVAAVVAFLPGGSNGAAPTPPASSGPVTSSVSTAPTSGPTATNVERAPEFPLTEGALPAGTLPPRTQIISAGADTLLTPDGRYVRVPATGSAGEPVTDAQGGIVLSGYGAGLPGGVPPEGLRVGGHTVPQATAQSIYPLHGDPEGQLYSVDAGVTEPRLLLTGPVTSFAVSPDGTKVAVVTTPGDQLMSLRSLSIVDRRTGSVLRTEERGPWAEALGWADEGIVLQDRPLKKVAAGTYDLEVVLLTEQGQEVRRWTGLGLDPSIGVSVAEHRLLAAVGARLVAYDLATGEVASERTLPFAGTATDPGGPPYHLAVAPGGRHVMVGHLLLRTRDLGTVATAGSPGLVGTFLSPTALLVTGPREAGVVTVCTWAGIPECHTAPAPPPDP